MKYLRKTYQRYLRGRKKGKSFEQIFVSRSAGHLAMWHKIRKHLKSNSKILEVGFGTGFLLSVMAKEGYKVYGVDNSPFSIKFAKRIFEDTEVKGEILLADGFNLPYPDNYFDLVFNLGVIEHIPWGKQRDFIQEMMRVSKSYILISVPNDSPKSFFNELMKTKYGIHDGEDYIPNFKKLLKMFNMKIILLGGSHIIVSKKESTYGNMKFYKNFKLDLPKKRYYPEDLNKLLKMEEMLPDEVLYQYGFLKYFLGKKK